MALSVAWGAGLVAMAGYAAAAWPWPARARWPEAALAIGWLAHASSLALDVFGVGADIPGARFGFAPALSATVWIVLAVHSIESRLLPLPAVRRVLALAGTAVVLLAAIFPGESRPHAGSPWLPLHWLLGVVSYGLLAVAVLHAGLLDTAERRLRSRAAPRAPAPGPLPLMQLERLTFRFVEVGFVVLTSALLLGASMAPWRWDHKTVLSLLGWAMFAVLIGGRHWRGWRGRQATRWVYAGGVLLLLAYMGSRFVLEVILHRGG
ncbi:MAG: cytochrome c biogenesis protein CcsA [Burkholderiaceae bacterium]|nr:cytochrome c biogenesis protein CcsA [Burkholderiaceae bacterium]